MDMPPLTPRTTYNKAPRKTTTQRGYGANWRRIRKAKLSANPICQMPNCSGKFASEVHHIDHNTSNNSPGNLLSTCLECHIKYHKSV